MDRIRIPTTVLARLQALGISPTDIVRRARVPPTLLQQERIVVTTAQWFALWDALAAYIDDPAFGLKLSQMVQGEPYDALSITALSAHSFHAALSKLARYKRLFSAEDLRVEPVDQAWRIEVVWLAAQQAPPPLLIDATFAHIIEVGQRGTRHLLRPERVALGRPAANRTLYEAYFGCPIDFDAERDTMLLSHATVMQPFATANPDLLDLLEPQLDAALRENAAPQTFTEQVKMLLRSRMAGRQPTTQDVAHELHISPRTLQRRLADEGIQFQHLLETVRHDLAKQYLRGSTLELNEIAFLLGYQESNSFHRAFHHWEGSSPGQWRAAQR